LLASVSIVSEKKCQSLFKNNNFNKCEIYIEVIRNLRLKSYITDAKF